MPEPTPPPNPGESSTPKPTKQAWQPKNKSDSEKKKDAAKEEKKAKRAAAVAQRGDGDVVESKKEVAGRGSATAGKGEGKGKEAGKKETGKEKGTAAATAGNAQASSSVAAISSTLLFSHLPTSHIPSSASKHAPPHPLIHRLGLLLSLPTTTSPLQSPQPALRGTNARTTALLLTFKHIISQYSWPPREMHRLLPAYLSPMIAYLEHCRPKGIAGGNVIRWLKAEINRIGTDESVREESEQKEQIAEAIDNYLRERIELADEVICSFATEKIKDGDTIVTYARSSLVEKVILEAWEKVKEDDEEGSFDVVVVDSGPLYEGKLLLRTLTAHSIPCTYTLLPSLPSIISKATLVLLGTAALLSDGSLYSRAGTAMVAMVAKENRVPVVAACETYKFGERVVLDAVTGNELGDGAMLLDGAEGSLTPIHLLYDLTPPTLVTAVCTEVGFIPPSSVPTVITKTGEAGGL